MTRGKTSEFAAVDAAAFSTASLISPLRYPGGKRRLLPYLARLIANQSHRPSVLIEPFAGGAAVAIGLLEHGFVPRIALSDADPLIATFWQVVFSNDESKALAKRIREADISLDEWKRLRLAKTSEPVDTAYKCLFLNRTSFSGILNAKAGPIGGQTQSGAYKIDARFPRERIADRIEQLSTLAGKVSYVRHQDFRKTFTAPLEGTQLSQEGRIFWYIDPPFWEKADRLYNTYFERSDHQDLAQTVKALRGSWVVSYDNHPDVVRLYADSRGIDHLSLRYTARSRSASTKSKELLFSNTRTLRGMAGRSLAVFENTVSSGSVALSPVAPAEVSKNLVASLRGDLRVGE